MTRLLILACSAVSLWADCLLVTGDRIRAADLAAALPAFAALPPDLPLAYAPAVGMERLFRAAEIERIARKHNLPQNLPLAGTPDICVEQARLILTPEEILAAMRATPGLPAAARIEIVDFARHAVPRGTLEFSLSGLSVSPASEAKAPVVWKGYVTNGSRRRYIFWTRVRVSAVFERVVAAQGLRSGEPVTADQVRLESHEGLLSPQYAASLDQVIGRTPRKPITAGAPVLLTLLESPKEIARGDIVDIEVTSGHARMAVTGKAQAAGRRGEVIPVRNTTSGKVFPARVAGKGKVVVIAGAKF